MNETIRLGRFEGKHTVGAIGYERYQFNLQDFQNRGQLLIINLDMEKRAQALHALEDVFA